MLDKISNNAILQPYIINGKVDYDKLNDAGIIEEYLESLSKVDPTELEYKDRLAFWLNSYNFLVLSAVLSKLKEVPNWKGVISLWEKFKFFIWNRYRIGERKVSLLSLENKILRKEFDDPRIHFALNCASNSCPYLPERLFSGDNLEEYLDILTNNFINEQKGVIVQGNTIKVSYIFKMYRKDFGDTNDLINFINQYYNGEDFPETPIVEYQGYDWGLNRLK